MQPRTVGSDIKRQHRTGGSTTRLTSWTSTLIHAQDHIGEAARSLSAYDGRDQSLLDIAEGVKETAQMVYERMRKKRREAGDVE